MKVLLLNPPSRDNTEYIREGRCMQAKSSWASLWMPITLAYASALLRADGHNVQMLDCIASKLGPTGLIDALRSSTPELVVLNTAFPTLRSDIATAGLIKRSFPAVKIAAIGLSGTILGEAFLREAKDVDYLILGEPEWTLRDLAKTMGAGLPLRDISGMLFREGETIVATAPQDMSRHVLDELPFPARDLVPNDRYTLPLTGQKFTLLSIGRGCPYPCSYCTSHLYYGTVFRKRSVSSVVDEIEECVVKHGITNFLFWGESFTMDAAYGTAICTEIIARRLNVTWSTTSRVDTLNPELLRLMKQAGCALLGLGIESVSQEVLDRARKGTTVQAISKAVSMVQQAGIRSMGHFVFGLSGDTKETAEETISFALDSGLDYAQFYCAVPYPRTALGELAEKNGWVEAGDPTRFDLSFSIMRNETLTARDIKNLRDSAYRRFYLRPRMLVKALKETRSLPSLLSSLAFFSWIRKSKE